MTRWKLHHFSIDFFLFHHLLFLFPSASIYLAERDESTAGEVLEAYINLRANLEQLKDDLPAKPMRELNAACENRDKLFFKNWQCASNVLDVRYRGQSLGQERLRSTMKFIVEEAWPALCPELECPPIEKVMEFVAMEGVFRDAGSLFTPYHAMFFWKFTFALHDTFFFHFDDRGMPPVPIQELFGRSSRTIPSTPWPAWFLVSPRHRLRLSGFGVPHHSKWMGVIG